MSKTKYEGEFEFNASKKMLYPYLSTASGLAQWFADDVNINKTDNTLSFFWDGYETKGAIVAQRVLSYVKIEFVDDDAEDDPSYLEFRLDMNELTQAVFLKVTDYSDMDDVEEMGEIWENLIVKFKEIVGG